MKQQTPQQKYVKKQQGNDMKKLQRWVHSSVYERADAYVKKLNKEALTAKR